MTARRYEIWDVFTDTAFAGNPLAVVFDGDGLSTAAMQTIAGEFNLSETTFVSPPQDSAHHARVRIFTPAYEMPFAGHPTVGTALALARRDGLSGAMRLELNAGVFPVTLSGAGFAEFENPNLPAETGDAPAPEAIERALRLEAGAVDRGAARVRRFGAGVDFVYARAPLEAVRAARLDAAAFEALNLQETVGVVLYAEGGDRPDATYHVRMFAPDAGVSEDPATGSAAAALPGHVARAQELADGERHWVIEQGFEMGRPSRIEARVETKGGAVTSVRIGGRAVRVAAGELYA